MPAETPQAPHSPSVDVSIVIPTARTAPDLRRTLSSLLGQQTAHSFEILVVGDPEERLPPDARIQWIDHEDLNPAKRRNAAAARASGRILAFIDDDASAQPDWLERACGLFEQSPSTVALGGPDPAPADSSTAELISETLLATPLIGSGIAAHENRKGTFQIRSPHDVALVNLFVRKEAFQTAGGFDEGIGYIGEDTDLVAKLMLAGQVFYSSDLVVHHRRRPFPLPYLRQRWRYRVKSGRLFARGVASYRRNPRVLAFLAAGILFFATCLLAPSMGALLLASYLLITLVLGLRSTRLKKRWWLAIPFAFAAHHATYFFGMLFGIGSELIRPEGR